jgi:hypothetical protein
VGKGEPKPGLGRANERKGCLLIRVCAWRGKSGGQNSWQDRQSHSGSVAASARKGGDGWGKSASVEERQGLEKEGQRAVPGRRRAAAPLDWPWPASSSGRLRRARPPVPRRWRRWQALLGCAGARTSVTDRMVWAAGRWIEGSAMGSEISNRRGVHASRESDGGGWKGHGVAGERQGPGGERLMLVRRGSVAASSRAAPGPLEPLAPRPAARPWRPTRGSVEPRA